MTNLEHLEAAEGCLNNDGRHTLAHVAQDAREEITKLRAKIVAAEMKFDLLAGYGLEDESPFICHQAMKQIAAEARDAMRA